MVHFLTGFIQPWVQCTRGVPKQPLLWVGIPSHLYCSQRNVWWGFRCKLQISLSLSPLTTQNSYCFLYSPQVSPCPHWAQRVTMPFPQMLTPWMVTIQSQSTNCSGHLPILLMVGSAMWVVSSQHTDWDVNTALALERQWQNHGTFNIMEYEICHASSGWWSS